MGDRYISYYECPKCKEQVEIYDAPSCLMYVEMCQNENCDFKVDKDYYETDPHTLELLTPEQARAKSIVPYCDRLITDEDLGIKEVKEEEKGTWYLVEGTIKYKSMFYSTEKKTAKEFLECRFRPQNEGNEICIVTEAKLLKEEKE